MEWRPGTRLRVQGLGIDFYATVIRVNKVHPGGRVEVYADGESESRLLLCASMPLDISEIPEDSTEKLSAPVESPSTASTLTIVATHKRIPFTLMHIYDGDTIRVMLADPVDEIIRILRIDTTERGEPLHEEATEVMREKLLGEILELEYEDPDTPKRGRYGRLLAYIFVDGRNIQTEMIREGWTPFFTRYGAGKYADEFKAAEVEARDAKRGIWASRYDVFRHSKGIR